LGALSIVIVIDHHIGGLLSLASRHSERTQRWGVGVGGKGREVGNSHLSCRVGLGRVRGVVEWDQKGLGSGKGLEGVWRVQGNLDVGNC